MRPVRHPADVPYILRQKIANGAFNWNGFAIADKAQVSASLELLQMGVCAYCQIRLDSSVGKHIEHLLPKSAYPALTFQWRNLVLSCTQNDVSEEILQSEGVSCGHYKGSRYTPQFISPTEPDCERYFEYRASDGTIQAAKGLSVPDKSRADYTIDLLNINCPRLCRLRKDMLEQGYGIIAGLRDDKGALAHFLDAEFAEVRGKVRSFISARQQHFSVFA